MITVDTQIIIVILIVLLGVAAVAAALVPVVRYRLRKADEESAARGHYVVNRGRWGRQTYHSEQWREHAFAARCAVLQREREEAQRAARQPSEQAVSSDFVAMSEEV